MSIYKNNTAWLLINVMNHVGLVNFTERNAPYFEVCVVWQQFFSKENCMEQI